MTKEQKEAIASVYDVLDSINTSIHNNEPITDNYIVLKSMETLQAYFQDDILA